MLNIIDDAALHLELYEENVVPLSSINRSKHSGRVVPLQNVTDPPAETCRNVGKQCRSAR